MPSSVELSGAAQPAGAAGRRSGWPRNWAARARVASRSEAPTRAASPAAWTDRIWPRRVAAAWMKGWPAASVEGGRAAGEHDSRRARAETPGHRFDRAFGQRLISRPRAAGDDDRIG